MSTFRRLAPVAGATLAFAAWEVIDHLFLMNAEMVTYHVIGFLAETALATGAIVWMSFVLDRAEAESERAERLAAVVVAAMATGDPDGGPLAALMKTLGEAQTATEELPAVKEQLQRIEHEAERIQAANRGLADMLLPHARSWLAGDYRAEAS